MKWAAAVLVVAACAGREPPSDCGGDLRGVWRTDDGRRFDVIRTNRGYEWYPMFDDRPDVPGAAPSMIEFADTGEDPLDGIVTRRYERGAQVCSARALARLHDCKQGRATLDLTPPAPPDFALCAAPPDARYLESWSLVRE